MGRIERRSRGVRPAATVKSSGIIDKGKDALLKKGRELGGEAISAAAKKVESQTANENTHKTPSIQWLLPKIHNAPACL